MAVDLPGCIAKTRPPKILTEVKFLHHDAATIRSIGEPLAPHQKVNLNNMLLIELPALKYSDHIILRRLLCDVDGAALELNISLDISCKLFDQLSKGCCLDNGAGV